MYKSFFTIAFALLIGFQVTAQKAITNEIIWASGALYPNYVPGFNFLKDGKHYTRLEDNKIQKYDLTTGEFVETIFDVIQIDSDVFDGNIDGYDFSADEKKIILTSDKESIYRRSSKANFFVFDSEKDTFLPIGGDGKQMYATFNSKADKVAYVFENNLYYQDLSTSKITQITSDGKWNKIINGALDWVYEEEFGFAQGFNWSPDGNKIAFYHFDESRVKEFTMTHFRGGHYPEYEKFKYPKVGEDNSIVNIHIYDLTSGNTAMVEIGEEKDQYIPRIKWTHDPNQLCVYRMNRHQNKVDLLLADAKTGKTTTLLSEENKYYIGEYVLDNLVFLEDGKHFIWTSEKDGWHHIYMYNMDGEEVKQLTKGEWEVTNVYGLDEKNNTIFYQAAQKSPLERQVYSISLDGKSKKVLADKVGWNNAQFSSTFDYYSINHSTANTPSSYVVYDRKGKVVREIETNDELKVEQKNHATTEVEFMILETEPGVELNAWMIKPSNFQANREYPVLMYVYGGPGSQTVKDQWMGQRYWWFQQLAQQGYIVVSVDNRGTGARGEEFKKMTYQQLGKYETIDQINAAKKIGELPYVDADRIGIFGWSYGGYMSSLAILKGNDVFKSAIAVAPVTNWKWYDTIYTERYMRTDSENPDGYKDNSPVNFADRLKGSYLLVHGMGDDNVHFQQSAEMVNALVNANKQFESAYYPNRNHGIYGGYTRLHLYTKMTNFLNANLKAKTNSVKP